MDGEKRPTVSEMADEIMKGLGVGPGFTSAIIIPRVVFSTIGAEELGALRAELKRRGIDVPISVGP